ncbi:MAG: hypothetical protein A2V64_03620 [Bacteroidetes bacterium RBG_13_43_22]|nr:MAG: hypothetical protein A2V64_03620 [Bacteroidetes bacterium RBG_13_43_22]
MNLRSLPILFFLICIPFPVKGQSDSLTSRKQAPVINKLSHPIIFDGIPDEEAWNSIEPIKLIMFAPVFGKEPTEDTDIRITYDDKYLYAGAWLYYKDTSMIISASYKRDFMGMGGDWLGFTLDTYNDKENGLMFFTSPDGLRFDAGVQRDAVVNQPDQEPINLSWNTFWDVLTNKNSGGWCTEIRVPLSSLRFQEINGEVRMGIIIQRWIPAKNETDLYPAIPPNWGQFSVMKPSQAQEIVFRGIKPDKPLYIAPYALAGFESTYNLNEDETEYVRSGDPVFEAGLDVKYGITSNLVLDLTANTDFAQVEADDQQVNLTRYSLYFPEKRLFFLERASVFDFNMGGNNNLFYSRRIGLSDNGNPVRILGGARLTGRLNKWDVGLMDMQTAPLWQKNSSGSRTRILPSENFGVLRMRRQVINDNTYIGAMATSRLGTDGSYNLAYGVDGIFRVFGEDYLDVKWSQTFEDSLDINSVKDPAMFMINWQRRSMKGLGYELGYSYSGEQFNPGVGFEMMDNYASVRGELTYGFIPGESSKIYMHSPQTRLFYRSYLDDGSLMILTNFTGWSFQTKNQSMLEFNVVYNREHLRDSLEVSANELYFKPGDYSYFSTWSLFSTPMSNPAYVMGMIQAGQYYDGNRLSVRLEPMWNISKHFELGGTYNFDHVRVSKRNISWTNHIVGLKALYMLNTKFSVNAFIQYNKSVHEIITNLRIRYNPKEGNDLYIVFNEGRNTDLTREIPSLPVYYSRAVMVKYTYTFNL